MTEDLGGGVSRRAAYEQVRRATGRSEKTTKAVPDLPACLQHVGDWWVALMPFYGRADRLDMVPPSQLAADIEVRFCISAKSFEINLLQEIFNISQEFSEVGRGESK